MPTTRLRVMLRRRRLYVDAGDLSDLLRTRARAYRTRADELTNALVDPNVLASKAGPAPVVPPLEEALACRMVAEELDQRADQLDAL